MRKITQIDPKNPDGWVNIGRVRVQEGNFEAAKEALDRALALNPDLARAHFFYARVLRQQGHYDAAIPHLQAVLAQYPRDRVVRDDLGRIYFLQRKYADALREFNATIAIDPEDLEANYNLMLTYTGLGQPDKAAEFQTRYLRFKADESAQTLTGPYLRTHEADNNERQPIHEHVSDLKTTTKLRASARSGDVMRTRWEELRNQHGDRSNPFRNQGARIMQIAERIYRGGVAAALLFALTTAVAAKPRSEGRRAGEIECSRCDFDCPFRRHHAKLPVSISSHNNGATGKKWLPETMGPGVAFIDYDNDGWQDILLVNGTDWPGQSRKHTTLALYHNNQNGTFTDVTQKAGLGWKCLGWA